jgi:hypothetical protein
MKQTFAVGFLSLALIGMATGPASAFLFHCGKCKQHCCCPPYNAFSPPCCCCCGPSAPQAPWGYGTSGPTDNGCYAGGDCGGYGGYGGYTDMGQLPPAGAIISPGSSGGPTFTPPMPTPTDSTAAPALPSAQANPALPTQGIVQPTSLQPGYSPLPYGGYGAGMMPMGGMPMGGMPMTVGPIGAGFTNAFGNR